MKLTAQQVRFFRGMGYLRFPEAVDEALVAELHGYLHTEATKVQGADSSTGGKLYRLYQRNPELVGRLVRHPAIVEPLRSLLGNNMVFLTNRHNHGTLHSPDPTVSSRLHRDVLQWSRPLVTVIAYLEDASVENGCTYIIPGSQYLPFVEIPGQTGGTWMDEHSQFSDLSYQALPIPMKKGSVLAFDATVFHAAGENGSNRTRTAITLAYRSVDELDPEPDVRHSVVVSGSYLYRGNDKM